MILVRRSLVVCLSVAMLRCGALDAPEDAPRFPPPDVIVAPGDEAGTDDAGTDDATIEADPDEAATSDDAADGDVATYDANSDDATADGGACVNSSGARDGCGISGQPQAWATLTAFCSYFGDGCTHFGDLTCCPSPPP